MNTKKHLLCFALSVLLLLSGCTQQATPASSSDLSAVSEEKAQYYYIPPDPPAPLPKVVDFYNSQLDPAIPKITIDVVQDSKVYTLPYTATVVTGEWDDFEGGEMNKTWFVELMNNFWSLPALRTIGLPSRGPTAYFCIEFEETPVGEVEFVDYEIHSERGYAPTYYNVEYSLDEAKERVEANTKTFTLEGNTLSFNLWDANRMMGSSNIPPLVGLRMKCDYGEQRVEYYLMFRSDDPWGEFSPTAPLTHLTPLLVE